MAFATYGGSSYVDDLGAGKSLASIAEIGGLDSTGELAWHVENSLATAMDDGGMAKDMGCAGSAIVGAGSTLLGRAGIETAGAAYVAGTIGGAFLGASIVGGSLVAEDLAC